jgi:hypothetical protein
MPSRVHACCDRSSDAARTALEAKDWYSESGRLTGCDLSINTGSGADAEILEGSPEGFACGTDGDSRAVGVASLVDGCDSFCFLGAGAGVALGGRPGPRFSPVVASAIIALVSLIRWFHVACREVCRRVVCEMSPGRKCVQVVTCDSLGKAWATCGALAVTSENPSWYAIPLAPQRRPAIARHQAITTRLPQH